MVSDSDQDPKSMGSVHLWVVPVHSPAQPGEGIG